MIAELLSNSALAALLSSLLAGACLTLGCWISVRPNYWASLGSMLIPESMRREPNPFAPAKSWRIAGQVVVSAGLAFTGIALWLMLSMTLPS